MTTMQLKIESPAILREGPADGRRFGGIPAGTNGVDVPVAIPNPKYGEDPLEPQHLGYNTWRYDFAGFTEVDGERLALFSFAGKAKR